MCGALFGMRLSCSYYNKTFSVILICHRPPQWVLGLTASIISQLWFSVFIYTWLALCCCRVRKLLGDCSVRRDKADHNHYMKLINAEDSCFLQYVVASLVEWFSSFQRSGNCHLLKYWELWAQQHSITSQKTWILRTTTARTPNLAWVVIISSVFKSLVLYLRGLAVVSCHLFS
jgi:hypothetical protein